MLKMYREHNGPIQSWYETTDSMYKFQGGYSSNQRCKENMFHMSILKLTIKRKL